MRPARATTLICLALLVLANSLRAAPALALARFSDLPQTHPAHAYVDFLAAQGIVNGYPDGRYGPDDSLTRAAAVKIGVGASEWASRTSGQQTRFPDLAASHWATPFVSPALEEGLVTGFDDGTFKPDDPLTRAQLAALAVRVTRQSQESLPDLLLSDVNASDWFYRPALLAVAAGLMDAPNGRFWPSAVATRAEAARAFAGAMAYAPNALGRPLSAQLTPIGLGVAVAGKDGVFRTASGSADLDLGQTVRTGASASATIAFGDGSSILLEPNTEMRLRDSRGNSSPFGTGTDSLRADLVRGKLFFILSPYPVRDALATGPSGTVPGMPVPDQPHLRLTAMPGILDPNNDIGSEIRVTLIGADGSPAPVDVAMPLILAADYGTVQGATHFIAAGSASALVRWRPGSGPAPESGLATLTIGAGQVSGSVTLRVSDTPWWEARGDARVRAVIGLPWGEAQVRGSAVAAEASTTRNAVSLLKGRADLVGLSGQSQPLTANQKSSIGGPGSAPAPVTTMVDADRQEWSAKSQWLTDYLQRSTGPAGSPIARELAELQRAVEGLKQVTPGDETTGSTGSAVPTGPDSSVPPPIVTPPTVVTPPPVVSSPPVTGGGGGGVTLAPTTLSLAGATAQYSDAVQLRATLTSAGAGVAAKIVTFRLDGEVVGSAATGLDGVALVTTTVTKVPRELAYTTTAAFAGDAQHSSSNAQTSLLVTPKNATITYTGETQIQGDSLLLKARVQGESDGFSGDVAKLGTIQFTVKRRSDLTTVASTTAGVGSDGNASATLNGLPAEPLTIEAKLTSTHYTANPATAMLDSLPAPTGAVLLQTSTTARVGDLITVSVVLQGVSEVKSALISVSFNPTQLQATKVIPGAILQGLTARNLMDNTAGRVDYWTATTGTPFSGAATYYQIEFKVLSAGNIGLTAITPDAKGALWGTAGYLNPSLGSVTVIATQ